MENIVIDSEDNGNIVIYESSGTNDNKNFGEEDIFYCNEIEVNDYQTVITEVEEEPEIGISQISNEIVDSLDVQNEIVIDKDNSSQEESSSYDQAIKNLNSISGNILGKKCKKRKRKISDEIPMIKTEPIDCKTGLLPVPTKTFFGSSMGVSKCHICNKFTKRSCFEEHVRGHFQNGIKEEKNSDFEIPNVFRCPECSYFTSVESDLNAHMDCHDASRFIMCTQCDFTTNSSTDMKYHMDSVHFENDNLSDINTGSISNIIEDQIGDDENCFTCNICGYKAYQAATFKNHVRKHYEEKSFNCPHCNYTTFERSSLVAHVRTHTGDNLQHCKVCEYTCAKKSTLKNHMKTHGEGESLECSHCDFTTKSKGSFARHRLLHEEEKPYKCSECEYQTVQKAALRAHMQRHTGVKPFKCPECDYSSVEKTHLIRHMRIHTGEKPIFCFVCDYRCIQFACLANHMKRHNGSQMHCAFCNFVTVKADGLISHLRAEHKRSWGKTAIPCPKCSFKCYTKENLKKHMNSHSKHKDDDVYSGNSDNGLQNMFECNQCDFQTSKKAFLKCHMKKIH